MRTNDIGRSAAIALLAAFGVTLISSRSAAVRNNYWPAHPLVRQEGDVRERTFEVRFFDAGVEAFCSS
jgi:hypothetical protein